MKRYILAILLIFFASNAYGQACLDISEGFETDFDYCVRGASGCATSAYDWAADSDSNYTAGSRSSTQAREGTYSLKINHVFQFGKLDWRAEYHWWASAGDAVREIAFGEEIWLSFSVFFPSDFIPDTRFGYLIFQFMQDREYGFTRNSTTTSNGAANGTTVIDSTIPSIYEDNFFVGGYVTIRSGAYNGQTRAVTGYTQSTRTLTVAAFPGQITSGTSYTLGADADPSFTGPPSGIYVTPNSTFQVVIKGDSRLVSPEPTQTNIWRSNLSTITPGQWHDFILHINKFDYDADNTYELWLRIGTGAWNKIVNESNIRIGLKNYVDWSRYAYLKFGPYPWFWTTDYQPSPNAPTPSTITLYYDAIKMDNDGVCTFEDMVPGSDIPATTGDITTPTSDTTYNTTSTPLTLEGTSTGASSVTCTNSLGGSCSCTGTNTWSCEVALLNGVNNVVVNFVGAAETDQDEIAVTKYLTVVDDQTVTFTGGLLYVDWQGTDNASVQMTASVNASSAGCDSFWVRWDTDPANADNYCWDTITTVGYETDTVSIRGNCDWTCADYDPYRFTLSQGYHVLYFVERETCVALASITFDEFSAPTPASPGMLGVYSATQGRPATYSATGFPIVP